MAEKLSHRERKADTKEGLREFKEKYPTMKGRLAAVRRGEQPTSAATGDLLGRARVIGSSPGNKAIQAILDHAGQGETPWLVLSSTGAGILAAFEDRLIIVKTGGWTSLMAGSLGGGRFTTFPYAQITGIEYNAGLVTGVLEVLTASYQGSANKDYWLGTHRSRNADSNDPFTLSNTLPWPKNLYNASKESLNELREKIAEAKRTVVVSNMPAAASPSLSQEIKGLAELRDAGALTDDEFAAAKARLLSLDPPIDLS